MRINRRQLLRAVGVGGALTLSPRLALAAPTSAETDPVARIYYDVLSRHTRWAEQQYDPAAGRYRRTDFGFAVVLGNAVLLTRGAYDADSTGVEKSVLHAHTVDTIRHFAASNILAGGSEWGKTLFWDTTFQSYFVLAARLLWADLDPATRTAVDTIARAQAAYTAALGTGDDPRSGDWTPNGLSGGFRGDTKLEEMGVYAQALAPGPAWAADDPDAGAWREAFGRWSRNEAGLPAADLANPSVVDGAAVSANTAANLYDTFIVENHGSYGPHYQEELWRTSGRNAVHFLLAGTPLPRVLTAQPNGERLWRTILATMSDAGEPLMPMVDDREHLYGRDVIPLAFRSQVLGDRLAARAEAALAERLAAYQAYPPVYRLAKFSGEAKYEPEARAELAISYLLHEWRTRTGPAITPVSEEEFFSRAAATTDYGVEPGLLAHQSAHARSGTVTKAGFTKFAWQPSHDDWLFVVSGTTPMLLPSTSLTVVGRSVAVYQRVRDGFDGTASLLTFAGGHVGTATLPTGTAGHRDGVPATGPRTPLPGPPGRDAHRHRLRPAHRRRDRPDRATPVHLGRQRAGRPDRTGARRRARDPHRRAVRPGRTAGARRCRRRPGADHPARPRTPGHHHAEHPPIPAQRPGTGPDDVPHLSPTARHVRPVRRRGRQPAHRVDTGAGGPNGRGPRLDAPSRSRRADVDSSPGPPLHDHDKHRRPHLRTAGNRPSAPPRPRGPRLHHQVHRRDDPHLAPRPSRVDHHRDPTHLTAVLRTTSWGWLEHVGSRR